MRRTYWVAIILCTFLTLGCNQKSSLQTKSQGIRISDLNIEENEDSPLSDESINGNQFKIPPQENLPPNSYLILGRIEKILPPGSFNNSIGRCKKEPCFAKIKVLELMQTGMALTETIDKGEEYTILFVNTLNGLSAGKANYTPLSEDDEIKALISIEESKNNWAQNGHSHKIINYRKL